MYTIILKNRLKNLSTGCQRRKSIVWWRQLNSFPGDKTLNGSRDATMFFRLRVGDYRILYTVNHGELIVYVIGVGNRGQVYNSYEP